VTETESRNHHFRDKIQDFFSFSLPKSDGKGNRQTQTHDPRTARQAATREDSPGDKPAGIEPKGRPRGFRRREEPCLCEGERSESLSPSDLKGAGKEGHGHDWDGKGGKGRC
jgi:hypothetical protein